MTYPHSYNSQSKKPQLIFDLGFTTKFMLESLMPLLRGPRVNPTSEKQDQAAVAIDIKHHSTSGTYLVLALDVSVALIHGPHSGAILITVLSDSPEITVGHSECLLRSLSYYVLERANTLNQGKSKISFKLAVY